MHGSVCQWRLRILVTDTSRITIHQRLWRMYMRGSSCWYRPSWDLFQTRGQCKRIPTTYKSISKLFFRGKKGDSLRQSWAESLQACQFAPQEVDVVPQSKSTVFYWNTLQPEKIRDLVICLVSFITLTSKKYS